MRFSPIRPRLSWSSRCMASATGSSSRTVYIFVDEYFPKDVRACAQGLFNAVILGVGALGANSLCPYLLKQIFTQGEVTNFHGLFFVPLTMATLAAVIL